MKPWESLLLAAGPIAAHDSIARSLGWLQAMAQQRQRFRSSMLTPHDASIGRNDSGPWTGSWTAPPATGSAPYTPVVLQGPLWFPIVPGVRADFTGIVDVPFASMDGWVGRRLLPAEAGTATTLTLTSETDAYLGLGSDLAVPAAGQTFTFSVWLKLGTVNPADPNWNLEIFSNDGTAGVAQQDIVLGDTWQLFSATCTFAPGTGPGLWVYVDGYNGASPAGTTIEVFAPRLVNTASPDTNLLPTDDWLDADYGDTGEMTWTGNDVPGPEITDPASLWAADGNWGSYFVAGSIGGTTQFIARVAANATWAATVDSALPGDWSFQLLTYNNGDDADADSNRVLIGNPWRESERPGDVRDHHLVGYTAGSPQFTSVSLTPGDPYAIGGTLVAFTATPGRTYRILVTEETDVEYAWALEPVSAAGSFTISRHQPMGGKVKLRLVEQVDGCSVRVVGQVWAEENAADPGAWPDLRIEYRAIDGSAIPAFPNSVQPAPLDRSWTVTLAPPSIGRVSLVNVNTKRIYGEYTMPSGLMRSYIVPPQAAGQNTASVYYDGFMDTCFLYDQAVALIGLLALGEQEAAARLVETLLLVQNVDGSFPFANNQFALDHNAGFIRNGAIAWVCYALLLADQEEYRDWFAIRTTDAAKASLAFIMGYTNALGTVNGGRGQYVDGVLDPDYVIPWWSVEHNVDTWWCLDLADRLYGGGDVDYRGAADALETALLTDGVGWDGTHGIFWQGGTVVAGVNTPDGMHALDTHTWGGALLEKWGLSLEARTSIARAYERYYLTDAPTGLSGFTTFVPEDGYPQETVKAVWYEGGFGAVAALRTIDPLRAQGLAQILVRGQRRDGSYLYALQEDTVNDIHPWPCLIAPAWNIAALIGSGRVLWK